LSEKVLEKVVVFVVDISAGNIEASLAYEEFQVASRGRIGVGNIDMFVL
jgi:hypothetical protein